MSTTLGIWSQKLLPNSPSVLEIDEDIRITNVALSENPKSKTRSVVKLLYEPQDSGSESDDEEKEADKPTQEAVLCSLIPGQVEQVSVDLTLTANDLVSISVTGNNEVHLLGNIVTPNLPYPEDNESDEEDESDMDEDEMRALYGPDMDLDDEEESDEEDGPKIEELPDQPIAKPSKKRAAEEEAPAKPSKKDKKETAAAAAKKEEPKKAEKKPEPKKDTRVTLQNGVSYVDGKVGDGPVAKSGKRVGMRYIGRVLKNGQPIKKVFDQNVSGKPFSFRVGTGEVIGGWDSGVLGLKGGQPMRVGGERTLYIPAKQAYGNQSLPGIGKNADLYFEIKLVEVK
ncbi:hypothetical protein WALSEDRAFT_60996 [Wallemia mellicola CBS 633.66]|uniref:peptidylprolyl isomerase n=2 Tax=Wallemia mellicola TaxID=1708541 RepID=I4Y8L2_WALMC|nr:hypothetical protein WALSEDRAFT_60996 [Wallemia mellicola CBS 633.66]EIM20304.1 hypothetical protein WALSEDRAFT_60996 [Wallemia mellicola CBS 633.66]TIB77897.1 hypothetical protein E3Q23_01104 [Wallemia mellicola]TIC02438.1 hypothetical protein E3Q17_01418 [Wallemia mellicola]|eukprot:XP_006959561.1 hypothetical protein WALSEDRAFT_60996 [Wallemia mellicola CBS 633.66]